MTNRPKQIGTAAETGVVRHAQAHGHPNVRRTTLHGNHDQGDIWLDHGIILEVKSGHAAETATDTQIQAWWTETQRERANAGADVAVLVTKRKGASPARCGTWNAHMDARTLLTLIGAPWTPQEHIATRMLRMSLDDLLALTSAYTNGRAR